jgi:hypothetical protein
MSTILSAIIDRVHQRAEKWRTQLVSELPQPGVIEQTSILGTYSMCLMNSRVRLVLERTAISLDHCKESPTSIARDYLYVEYGQGPPARHTQVEAVKVNMSAPPNYARPAIFGHGYYVDIRAAYWNIMRVAGWNPDYWPGKWLLPGKPPVSFPFPDHKVARNCLVSSGLIGKVPMWSPDRGYFEVFKGNPFANLQLWRLIQDVLNAIAVRAVEAGAIYVNTDGFIAPTLQVRDKVQAIIADWGLESCVKSEGAGQVVASGTYQVGNMQSGHLKSRQAGLETFPLELPPHSRWLQTRFSHFAAKRT